MNESSPPVRIGPISLFALIAVLCLATLAVLSISTARASMTLAEMQADSVIQQYAAESAAQDLVAQVDAIGGSPSGDALASAAAKAQASAQEGITVSAALDGANVTASFACPNGRLLDIELAPQDGGWRIVKWNLVAKVNSAETETLWSGM